MAIYDIRNYMNTANQLDEGATKDWLWNQAESMSLEDFVENGQEMGFESPEEATSWWNECNGVEDDSDDWYDDPTDALADMEFDEDHNPTDPAYSEFEAGGEAMDVTVGEALQSHAGWSDGRGDLPASELSKYLDHRGTEYDDKNGQVIHKLSKAIMASGAENVNAVLPMTKDLAKRAGMHPKDAENFISGFAPVSMEEADHVEAEYDYGKERSSKGHFNMDAYDYKGRAEHTGREMRVTNNYADNPMTMKEQDLLDSLTTEDKDFMREYREFRKDGIEEGWMDKLRGKEDKHEVGLGTSADRAKRIANQTASSRFEPKKKAYRKPAVQVKTPNVRDALAGIKEDPLFQLFREGGTTIADLADLAAKIAPAVPKELLLKAIKQDNDVRNAFRWESKENNKPTLSEDDK